MLLAHFLPFFSPFYLINMLFGVSELIIKTFIGGVLSLKFPENSYESFATYRFVSNLASGVAMIISSMFTPEVPLVLMISVFLNIFVCYRSTNDIKRHLDMPPDALLMSSTSRWKWINLIKIVMYFFVFIFKSSFDNRYFCESKKKKKKKKKAS